MLTASLPPVAEELLEDAPFYKKAPTQQLQFLMLCFTGVIYSSTS
jgi:hypothetical protein